MSTHIKMADEYSTVTTYYGQLDDKHSFMVEISYNSEIGDYNITSVEFIGDRKDKSDFYWNRSENKIRNFTMKWLFHRQGESYKKDYGPPYGPHNPTGNEG